jgi:hypothetical protein
MVSFILDGSSLKERTSYSLRNVPLCGSIISSLCRVSQKGGICIDLCS